jgi:hypothetical protein
MSQVGMPLLATIRSTILSAFKALPLLLISFIAFLAVGLGNLSLFLLFFGHAVLVPGVTELLHIVTKSQGNLIVANEISQLVASVPTSGASYNTPVNVLPSYWMAHIMFFFGYLFANAIDLYTLPAASGAADWMVTSRKTRAATLIASTSVLAFVFTCLRYYLTGTESIFGIALSLVLAVVGIAWYWSASALGSRTTDIFGVVQQMVPQTTGDTKPVTCVYAPTP